MISKNINFKQAFRELEISDFPDGQLKLVKPSIKNAEKSLSWVSNPEVSQYMGVDFSGVSIDTERKRISELIEGNDVISWAIQLNDEVIGNIEINSVEETSVAYDMRAGRSSTIIGEPKHWGKRIAQFAKAAVMDWAFDEGGFELIVAKVLPANVRSCRSLERSGFEPHGDNSVGGHKWRIYLMSKQHWVELRRHAKPNPIVIEAVNILPKGASILDIGAGIGRNTLYLAGLGFEVTALEPDKQFCEDLRRLITGRNLSVNIVQDKIEDFQTDAQFDAIVATAVFHFLRTKDQTFEVINKVKRMTRQGGLSIVTVMLDKEVNNPRPYLFQFNELSGYYGDWEIVKYEEVLSKPYSPSDGVEPIRSYVARLIARKI